MSKPSVIWSIFSERQQLRAKSTTQSYRTPVYYVDLTLRDGAVLADVVSQARTEAEQAQAAGIDTAQLEAAAKQLLQNGQFEDTDEEVPQLLEEFYPAPAEDGEEATPRTPIRPARLTRQLGSGTAAA
jgi:hypothetical protein